MLKDKVTLWSSVAMFPEKKHISKYRLNRFLQSENQINRICNEKNLG